MKVIRKNTFPEDIDQYKIGDVLKLWNDNEDNPDYAMITALGAEYHLTFLSGTDLGKTSLAGAYDIPTLIMDWHKYVKHIQRVRFYGTDLGRKVGNY